MHAAQPPRRAGGRHHDLPVAGREGDASAWPTRVSPTASTSACSGLPRRRRRPVRRDQLDRHVRARGLGEARRVLRSAPRHRRARRPRAQPRHQPSAGRKGSSRLRARELHRPLRLPRRRAARGRHASSRRCSSTASRYATSKALREHYALTLRHWVANLEANWDEAVELVGLGRARGLAPVHGRVRAQLREGCEPRSTKCSQCGPTVAHRTCPCDLIGAHSQIGCRSVVEFAFLDHPGPIPFAHRGGAGEWPENTMPAFEGAVRLGYRYVETDVHVTADGVLLAFHDDVLDRVTDHEGVIAKLPWAVGAHGEGRRTRADPAARGAARDVARPARQHRSRSTTPRSSPLVEVIEKHDAVDRVCIGSFSERARRPAAQALGPRLCTALGPKARAAARGRVARRIPVGRFRSPAHRCRPAQRIGDDRRTSASSTPPTSEASRCTCGRSTTRRDGAAARPRRRRDHDRPARRCSGRARAPRPMGLTSRLS